MKGTIFTEFSEMGETKFGLDTVNNIIEKSKLTSKGSYTTLATYDFNETVALISQLSQKTEISVRDLINTFGLYLFSSLFSRPPEVIQNYRSPIVLLYFMETHRYVYVKKMYTAAELQTFKNLETTYRSIIYSSLRRFYRLANGLIEKTFEYFNGKAEIIYVLLKQDDTKVKFDIV